MKKIGTGAAGKVDWERKSKWLQSDEGIAHTFAGAEKCPFIIRYIPFTKGIVMSELNRIGCSKIKELDFADCVAVRLTKGQLKEVLELDCVKTIEKDYDYQVLNCGAHNANGATHWTGGYKANGKKEIKLAVFDTDVYYTLVADSVWFADKGNTSEEGHGTLMTAIVSTRLVDNKNFVAEPCVYSAVVANDTEIAKTSSIMAALDWAICNEINVVSMSFGGYHRSVLLEEMIDRAASYGIIMVAAAGNDGVFEPIMYPAAYANVLSVGAKKGRFIAHYSNGGESADCYASGEQKAIDWCDYCVCVAGTSGATAYVAGMILEKWCVHPDMTAADVVSEIRDQMSFSASEDFSVPRNIGCT